MIEGRRLQTVPMQLIVSLGSIVDFNVPMLETVFAKIGMDYKYENFAERLNLARFWLEQCAPDQVNRLRSGRNWDVFNSLSEQEQREIAVLHDYLKKADYSLDDLNSFLYAVPKMAYGDDIDDKAKKKLQAAFFRIVYQLLIDKEQGPRLYLFLYALKLEDYLPLLDFSHPITAEEEAAAAEAAAAAAAASAAEAAANIAPPKDEIVIDDFGKLDLRVCEVKACEEIKKSRNCLKLTLFDGWGERVIVSSIKGEYQPEELVGKKIIVVANLKPAKIAGVKSQGMLLAATHEDCGCRVIFVDDSVPAGVAIS